MKYWQICNESMRSFLHLLHKQCNKLKKNKKNKKEEEEERKSFLENKEHFTIQVAKRVIFRNSLRF